MMDIVLILLCQGGEDTYMVVRWQYVVTESDGWLKEKVDRNSFLSKSDIGQSAMVDIYMCKEASYSGRQDRRYLSLRQRQKKDMNAREMVTELFLHKTRLYYAVDESISL